MEQCLFLCKVITVNEYTRNISGNSYYHSQDFLALLTRLKILFPKMFNFFLFLNSSVIMESDSQQVIQKLNFRVSLLLFSNFLLYFLLFGDSCIILAFIPTYFTHKTLSISDKSGACSLWLHSL